MCNICECRYEYSFCIELLFKSPVNTMFSNKLKIKYNCSITKEMTPTEDQKVDKVKRHASNFLFYKLEQDSQVSNFLHVNF